MAAPSVVCLNCRAPNASFARFCVRCGAPLQAAIHAATGCPRCGAQVPPEARFCVQCGSPIQAAAPPRPICTRCGFDQLVYFTNNKGICNRCRHIFSWAYAAGGGVVIYESSGLDI